MPFLHVAEMARWRAAREGGTSYTPVAYDREGFIHCCTAAQLAGVAQRYFAGRSDLVLLEIDEARLTVAAVWEGATERFPHLYAPLPLEAVVAERPLSVDAAGRIRE